MSLGTVVRLRHDLRTLISQIIGYSELLQEELTSDGQTDYATDLGKIESAARRILDLIDRLLESPDALSEEEGAEEEEEKAATILVVDDNEMNRDVLSRRLKRQGYEVEMAADGPSALKKIDADEPPIDLVLLDVMMPGMSGLEVLETVRKTRSRGELPVIMVTAKSESEDVVQALEKGANDYVTKPIDFAIVRARSEAQIALKRAIGQSALLARQLELRNSMIRQIFGRYITDQVVASLLENPDGLKLGGEKRNISILMADLRGFTSLSERLRPEQVVAMLNNYLGTMADVIGEAGGTVDEFQGDGILVLFGAPVPRPDHARAALECALKMELAIADVNRMNREAELPEVQMGVGINTGDVVVGNIGSEKRTKYGVVGSNVNLTSRIESYTVGGQILASAQTIESVGDKVRVDGTIEVQPKGVGAPITLYEVGGIPEAGLELRRVEDSMSDLSPRLAVEYFTVSGKDSSGQAHKGEITRLSHREAEIAGPNLPPAMTNLRLRFSGDGESDGAEGADFYAKVLGRRAAEEGNAIIHFTSLPPQVEARIAKLVPAQPPEAAP